MALSSPIWSTVLRPPGEKAGLACMEADVVAPEYSQHQLPAVRVGHFRPSSPGDLPAENNYMKEGAEEKPAEDPLT